MAVLLCASTATRRYTRSEHDQDRILWRSLRAHFQLRTVGKERRADGRRRDQSGGRNQWSQDRRRHRRRSGQPGAAATVVNKLTRQDKVVAIIAGGASGNSLAAGPNAQSAKVPMISPSSTNPAVTQTGDYIFRACFIDAFQGEVMAKFADNSLQAKKAAIMLDFNSPYSRGLTEFFELSFAKLGGRIVSQAVVHAGRC